MATTPSGNNGNSSTPTITVLVTPTDPAMAGSLDQAPVEVSITTASVKHALVVPVDALLALASGGDALEVVSPKGVHTLEPVSLGLFDDADELVQVTGPGVTAGQRIVIPADVSDTDEYASPQGCRCRLGAYHGTSDRPRSPPGRARARRA